MSSSKEHLKKLTTFLHLFSPAEWKGWMLYVQSPLFKLSPNAQKLAFYYDTIYPAFSSKNSVEEKIAKKYPVLASKAAQAKAGSELLKAAEAYLVLCNMQAAEFENNLALLKVYDQKRMSAEFTKLHAELTIKEEEKGIQDYFAFERLYKLKLAWFDSYQSKSNRTTQNDITKLSQLREKDFALKQLYAHCTAWLRHHNFGTPLEIFDINWVLETLKEYETPQHSYVFVYVKLLNCLSLDFDDSILSYDEIKAMYLAMSDRQPLPDALIESTSVLSFFCSYWSNKGKEAMAVEYLWWTEQKLRFIDLLTSGLIELATYRGYIINSVITHQPIERLSKFMDTYSKFLPPNIAPTHLNFCNALYSYHIGEIEKALALLNDAMVKEEPIFNAIVRRWEFVILFESKANADMLIYKLDAFEKYILREKKEMHVIKTKFNHFISSARKLIKARSKVEKQQLKTFFEKEANFPAKSWMLEMLEK